MKKTILTALTFLAFIGVKAQFKEDFENGVPGKMIQEYSKGETNWKNFSISTFNVDNPLSGSNSAIFFNGLSLNSVSTSLRTPVLNLSSSDFSLEFKYMQKVLNREYNNELIVELSNDNGKNWENIASYYLTDSEIQLKKIELKKTTANSIIRFKATQNKIDTTLPIVIDDIEIYNTKNYESKLEESNKNVSQLDNSFIPNPSNGIFTFISNKASDINIVNIEGKVVYSAEKVINETTVDLTNFEKGFYFARISTNGETKTQKLILK